MVTAHEAKINAELNLAFHSVMNELSDAVELAVDEGKMYCIVKILDNYSSSVKSSTLTNRICTELSRLGYKFKLDNKCDPETHSNYSVFSIRWDDEPGNLFVNEAGT